MHLLHYLARSSKSTVADIRPFMAKSASYIFAKDHEGRSVLFFAAERGNLIVLEYLLVLPNRPSLSETDVNGLSLMHYAVKSSRAQTVDVLHNHGCEIDAVDENNQTALHHAVRMGNLEGAKRLLALNGHKLLEVADVCGLTPLGLAVSVKELDLAAYLRSISPTLSGTMSNSGNMVFLCKLHRLSNPRFSARNWSNHLVFKSHFWHSVGILAVLTVAVRLLIVPLQ